MKIKQEQKQQTILRFLGEEGRSSTSKIIFRSFKKIRKDKNDTRNYGNFLGVERMKTYKLKIEKQISYKHKILYTNKFTSKELEKELNKLSIEGWNYGWKFGKKNDIFLLRRESKYQPLPLSEDEINKINKKILSSGK